MGSTVDRPTPSIWQTAITSWRGVMDAVRRLPRLTASTICICFALYLTVVFAPSVGGSPTGWIGHALSVFRHLGVLAVGTAVGIRIGRRILLGDTADHYVWQSSRHFWPSIAWGGLLDVFTSSQRIAAGLELPVPPLMSVAIWIAVVFASVRLALIFPAIAIDAPGRGWRAACAMSKGHFWYIGLTLLCTVFIGWALQMLVTIPIWLPLVHDSTADLAIRYAPPRRWRVRQQIRLWPRS